MAAITSRRTLALVAAIVLAAVGAVALLSYVQGLEERAFEGVETVEVYLAKQAIPAGASADQVIDQGLIEQATIPRRTKAPTAITALEQIRGRVAAVDIFANEQIIAERFVAPGEARGRLPIPQGRQAMSVEVGLPPGVAGFIRPADRVSVLAQLSVPRGGGTEDRAQFLLQNIEVLAVGSRTVATRARTTQEGQSEEREQRSNRILLTLALSPGQVERLAYALFNGEIYFTLLPAGARPADTPGRTARNVFP